MPVQHLSPRDVAARLASDTPPVILDVRERWEHELAHIEPSELVPLASLPERANGLDPQVEYAMLCHHGMRSEMAANWLAQHGFTRLINIEGGIDAWSREVDTTIPRY